MPFETLKCPVCSAQNMVDTSNDRFFCTSCGKSAFIEAARSYTAAMRDAALIQDGSSIHVQAPDTADMAASMVKRSFLFLEELDWSRANSYCEAVLDFDPENARAYLCELLSKLRLKNAWELTELRYDFREELEWKRAIRYADEDLAEELKAIEEQFEYFEEQRRLEDAYNSAMSSYEIAESANEYREAAAAFSRLGDYKDSKELQLKCRRSFTTLKTQEEAKAREDARRAIEMEKRRNSSLGCLIATAVLAVLVIAWPLLILLNR